MSYILSALRRAEADRRAAQQDGRTQLAALEPDRAIEDSNTVPATWVIGALAVVALLVLGYWLLPLSRPAPVATSNGVAVAVAIEKPVTPPAPETRPATHQEPLAPAPVAAQAAPPKVDELPPLPTINITGYIYFEDKPETSKLFVDGIVYRLHSRLAEGLTVEGFQPDVVIVNYRGQQRQLRVK